MPIEWTIKGKELLATDNVHNWGPFVGTPIKDGPPIEPPPPPPGTKRKGVWISDEELKSRPITGAPWESVLAAAKAASATGANLSDQNSTHDMAALSCALAGVRLNDTALIAKGVAAVVNAIGTEEGARWLAIGRNLAGYVIAADILNLRAGQHGDAGAKVQAWLERMYVRTLKHNNEDNQIPFRQAQWQSGSNAAAQQGFAYACLCVYLGEKDGLAACWDGFRRYAGDRTSPHKINENNDAWQEVPGDSVGIQNKGAAKGGCRLDGAISNDMFRGGSNICKPGQTDYPWVGMFGAVSAALVLHRAGYPAFEVADQAIFRAADYLRSLGWYDANRAAPVKWIINKVYNVDWPCRVPVGGGQVVGFLDWTHPAL